MDYFVDENVVMRFYLDRMNAGQISFLEGKDQTKRQISEMIRQMLAANRMNERIAVVKRLWKVLFEAAMSSLDRNKQGYDKIFAYFDEYVEFEELIFASDSFYRDHTLHCMWVYFLGEYLAHQEQFDVLFESSRRESAFYRAMRDMMTAIDQTQTSKSGRMLIKACEMIEQIEQNRDAIRCISALTHDLGYPLKKIEKINKSIGRILPYYSVGAFSEFHFEYGNVNQPFINTFLRMLSSDISISIDVADLAAEALVGELFITDGKNAVGLNRDRVQTLTDGEKKLLAESINVKIRPVSSIGSQMRTYNDFESYQHGIMSAFLLTKNVRAFQNTSLELEPSTELPQQVYADFISKSMILSSITLHTCDAYKIQSINDVSFLTFIDELEEFSRISRASQSREYVEEFCASEIYMNGGWFSVDFTFQNEKLDNLNPAKAFRGRCKRFLTLFDIPKLDDNLKIRLRCIGALPWDRSVYQLELARKYARITVDGVEQDIPSFLKSTQFCTSEEYARM